MNVTIKDIEAAAERLREVAVRTPLIHNAELDKATGGRVFVKPECLQVTGSFKIRGAYNLMSQLNHEQAQRGVVAWSSGNHAQGVAAAAGMLDAPLAKLENTKRLGGEVITYDRYTGDREQIARAIAAERGAELVPSYDHLDIIAGQGTMGLEIAEQMVEMGEAPDQVLICCGGGGLSSGSAIAIKDRFADTDVFTVEPNEFDDTARSLAAGERLRVSDSARSICDALQAHMPGELTFDINRRLIRAGLAVTDEEVEDAMRFAFKHLKLVAEPGGAVALAAALSGKVETADKTTVAVISGGNVDFGLFASIMKGAA
jgi:threonine dehydratase